MLSYMLRGRETNKCWSSALADRYYARNVRRSPSVLECYVSLSDCRLA